MVFLHRSHLQSLQRLPLAIFLVFSAFYLLTMSGHLYSPDEETMYLVTQGIALRGDVAVVADAGAPVAALRPGIDGQHYSPYGILPSLLALPLFAVGALAAPFGTVAFDYATRMAVSSFNGLVTAATVALLAAWCLRLRVSPRKTFGVMLLYGVCTFAWPYARTFFSEPLTALLLLIAVERIATARSQRDTTWLLFVAGIAAGLMVATRLAGAIALPLLAVYVLWPPRPHLASTRSTCIEQLIQLVWRGLVWGSGLLPGFALLLAYNIARFDTLLATGYTSEAQAFTTPLAEGIVGLLFSPGKSLLLYAPPVLLALPGAMRLWKHQRGLVVVILSICIAYVGLYAQWSMWWGGGVWGPRFLLPIIPLLIMLAAATFANDANRQRGVASQVAQAHPQRSWPLARWSLTCATLLLGLAGLIGNLGGVLVNFDTYLNMSLDDQQRIYKPAASPLYAHWQIFINRSMRYHAAQQSCALGMGFTRPHPASPSDTLLPRRTGPQAQLQCQFTTSAQVTMSIVDWHPPDAPASTVRLGVDGRTMHSFPADQSRITTLLLPPGRSSIDIVTTRNSQDQYYQHLGVVVSNIRIVVAQGVAQPLIDTAIAPLSMHPAEQWAWFYDPFNQHLIDHWLWYLRLLALPPALSIGVSSIIIAIALAAILGAVVLYCPPRPASAKPAMHPAIG